jgi:acyl-CoA thioester hydrolase
MESIRDLIKSSDLLDMETAEAFHWLVRIYYEDTDAGGVVYYANYLRYLERARTEWLRALGYEQDVLREDDKVLFAVRSINVRYLRPAFFNDELSVTVELEKIGRASLEFQQNIYRQQELLTKAMVNIVCLHEKSLAPSAIPQPLLNKITRWK